MRIKFKPMPGLSIAVLICFAILATLGTWQYKRLLWKTDLIIQIDQAANAAPLTSLSQASLLLAAGHPLDFRRIELDGRFVRPQINNGQPFHVSRSDGKRFFWQLYQPYRADDKTAYVATHKFTDAQKNAPPDLKTGQEKIVGYVRIPDMTTRFMPKNNPETNRWFVFNANPEIINWAGPKNDPKGDAKNEIETAYFIDQVFGVETASELPVRIPEIANNHLDYMLTWYSFIFILLVIYLLIHKRAGRLYLER